MRTKISLMITKKDGKKLDFPMDRLQHFEINQHFLYLEVKDDTVERSDLNELKVTVRKHWINVEDIQEMDGWHEFIFEGAFDVTRYKEYKKYGIDLLRTQSSQVNGNIQQAVTQKLMKEFPEMFPVAQQPQELPQPQPEQPAEPEKIAPKKSAKAKATGASKKAGK